MRAAVKPPVKKQYFFPPITGYRLAVAQLPVLNGARSGLQLAAAKDG